MRQKMRCAHFWLIFGPPKKLRQFQISSPEGLQAEESIVTSRAPSKNPGASRAPWDPLGLPMVVVSYAGWQDGPFFET